MSKNVICVFSGTGNSLWAAKEISKELENCEIVSMGINGKCLLPEDYDAIGFVYPTYGRGIPKQVEKFILHLDLHGNKDAYFFAVATCGRLSRAGNSITQLRNVLKHKGIKLSYGERLDMFSNYVIMYDMRDTVEEETKQSAINIEPIVRNIKDRATDKGNTISEPFQKLLYIGFMHFASNIDKKFNVSDACVKCNICKKVCLANNIDIGEDGKPYFLHHCEQCLACIQNCPAKAINYKDKTQNRKRYMHPDISWEELARLNGYENK